MGLLVAVDVYKGGVPIQHYEFSSDTQRMLRMGKLPTAQVRVDDPAASRIHAVIHLSPTEAVLTDMGAESGTAVNGRRVSKVRLSHGDQITVGETTLVVGLGVSGPAAVGAPMPAAEPASQPVATAPVMQARPVTLGAPVATPFGAGPAWHAAAPPPVAAPPPAPPAAPPSQFAMPEPIQRVASKLITLSPESLAEAERYVDWLNARQAGAAGAASHEGLARPGAAFATDAPPQRDTNTFIQQMRRNRRTHQLAIAGVMLAVVVVLALIALRAPPNTVPDESGRPPPRPTGAPPAATAEAPTTTAMTPPEADDKTVVYRLPRDQSPHDLAVELWHNAEHASLLLQANPQLAGAEAALPKDTFVRIPRSLLTPELEVRLAASLAPTPAADAGAAPTPGGATASPAPGAAPAPAATPAPTAAPSTGAAPTHAAAHVPAPSTSAATPAVTPPPAPPPGGTPAPDSIPAPVPEPESSRPTTP